MMEYLIFIFSGIGVIMVLSAISYMVCFHGAKGWYRGKQMVEEDAKTAIKNLLDVKLEI